MNADETVLDHLTERIIGSALTVSNALGAGFLEKVYENALVHELRKAGLAVAQQRGVTVMYHGVLKSIAPNASTTFGQRACKYACCSTSTTRVWTSSASFV